MRGRRVTGRGRWWLLPLGLLAAPAGETRAEADEPGGAAGELARFVVDEPLGRHWSGDWITEEVTVDAGARAVEVGSLRVVTSASPGPEEGRARRGRPKPPRVALAPFQLSREDAALAPGDRIEGRSRLRLLCRVSLRRDERMVVSLRRGPLAEGEAALEPPPRLRVERGADGRRHIVTNGVWRLVLDDRRPLPLNDLSLAGAPDRPLGHFAWPEGIAPLSVRSEWTELGPARGVLRREFAFGGEGLRYVVTFDLRAGDPWIGIVDEYALGPGTSITLDLRPLRPDVVYHPHTYNPRTFGHDGKAEDSTLQPPQHPIATLGPVWRDIWFGGGPYAYVHDSKADPETGVGLGVAAVRGSRWRSPDHVSLESQNLFVDGDRERPGQVRVRIPTDAGTRHWALILGPPSIRKRIGDMIRAHADTPLDRVRREWVLDWESDAPEVGWGMAGQWLGHFNQHSLNPTTFPRSARSTVRRLLAEKKRVKSRDLAAVAYAFSNPDYWPGPGLRWKIGNPNFHTDMYSVPLLIGLLMPEHPHAKRWVARGVEEVRGNIERDSYPGGAWAESLSYSAFFFHIVDLARRLRDAGAARPFRDWPRIREVARYLAAMHTPVDPRYGSRQKAPIGDTSPGDYIDELRGMADLYEDIDDRFARQLSRFPRGGEDALDISSREFFGFGAMLRGSPYDARRESFVTIKAGPARNHYQGDELSFHFAGLGAPLAIDHACHYSPRPWHAAMHNRPDMAGKRPAAIAARRAFRASAVADVFCADERTRRINVLPLEPHETRKPGWEYPWEELPEDAPWTMRRWAMLVKHDPARSRIADYLVIRDEISSPEPVRWNLHVLARDLRRSGQTVLFPGQLDVDLTARFVTPELGEVESREWGWSGKGGDRRTRKGREYEETCFGEVIPEDFEGGSWTGGERTRWLRVIGPADTSRWLIALFPHRRGEPAPSVEPLSATSFRVTLGAESEVIHLGTEGAAQAAVERGGERTELLRAGEVPGWADVEFRPVEPGIDQGAL